MPRSTTQARIGQIAGGIAALTLIGGTAACGSSDTEAADSPATTSSAAPAASSAAASAASSTSATAPAPAGAYADGSYTAEGSYTSPAGEESVSVSLTITADTVSAVTVTPEASNPNSQRFQGQFASGIAAEIVGKPIDSLAVSKVSGSSLTSGGFNSALETIKAEAKA